ncbi:MAG: phosphoglucosamine mutase [Fidelibacterota bacterium]
MIIRSISGVRGLTESHLTPHEAELYAQAVDDMLPAGVIMIGRDSRPSGQVLQDAIVGRLNLRGRHVIVCGIVPTPTIQFMVENTEAAGGIIITASHNPAEWNGLKFVRGDGTFFLPAECKALFHNVDRLESLEGGGGESTPMIWQENNANQKHVLKVLSLSCLDINRIRSRKFRVVIDAVNGAGSEALPLMLESLGCKVVELNCSGNGEFTRGTEPLPENLTDLCKTITREKADVGFAVDPDADRLAVVDETGLPLGEEYTLVLAVDGYIRNTGREETFVTNLSTSMALDWLARDHGCTVKRTPVGEINVVKKMQEISAELGGEGNGGVILKEAHLGRDSLVAVAMVLNRLAQDENPMSTIKAGLPQFEIVKGKINLEQVCVDDTILEAQKIFEHAEINTIDGIKFSWDDRWIHLRRSNTEPIMRLYAEAPTAREAEDLIRQVKALIPA